MVAVYFFLPIIIASYGRKGFNRLLLWIAIVTSIFGVLGVVTGAIPRTSAPAFGLHPILIAMISMFGLKNPFATIYVLIFPIQASWVAWGSDILCRTQLLCWTFPRIFTGHWRLGNRLSFCHWQWTDQTKRLWRKYTAKAKHNKRLVDCKPSTVENPTNMNIEPQGFVPIWQ